MSHTNEYAEFDSGNLRAWSNEWGEIVIALADNLTTSATLEPDVAAALAEWIQGKVGTA